MSMDIWRGNIQNEKEIRLKQKTEMKQSIGEQWDNFMRYNIHVTVVQEGENSGRRYRKKYLKNQ